MCVCVCVCEGERESDTLSHTLSFTLFSYTRTCTPLTHAPLAPSPVLQPCVFKMSGPERRTYVLAAESESERARWAAALTDAIDKADMDEKGVCVCERERE